MSLLLFLAFILIPGAHSWSKEGHVLTCQIAEALLESDVAEAVRDLLPEHASDLSEMCTWPDQIRHVYRYRWTSPLHFIDTPDDACTFDYSRDCHDEQGTTDGCVAGAIQNFTTQLSHFGQATSDPHHNMTEALLFLSHFMGDIHQPLHVGFASDEGGNTIDLRWFKHKSNLHHVWDAEIIFTAASELFSHDFEALLLSIEKNMTEGSWSHDVVSWKECEDLDSCVDKYAEESAEIACEWAYKGVEKGETLRDEYFSSRFPIVMKRIAQGGVRLALFLNRVLSTGKK